MTVRFEPATLGSKPISGAGLSKDAVAPAGKPVTLRFTVPTNFSRLEDLETTRGKIVFAPAVTSSDPCCARTAKLAPGNVLNVSGTLCEREPLVPVIVIVAVKAVDPGGGA
jgi:hypothetical protein